MHAFANPTLPEDRPAVETTMRRRMRACLLAVFVAAALLPLGLMPAAAQPSGYASACAEPGMNLQCNDFGTIAMPSQGDIRGERIAVTATVSLDTAYADREARWILFSVRNFTEGSPSPVSISLERFATAYGDVIVTETRADRPAELALWVHVIDAPIATPIELDLSVGSAQRGAFRLEVLVMPFDRGYAPIADSWGEAISLFSFTLLGVNEETSAPSGAGGGSKSGSSDTALLTFVHIVPGAWLVAGIAAVVVLGAVLLFRARRRSR